MTTTITQLRNGITREDNSTEDEVRVTFYQEGQLFGVKVLTETDRLTGQKEVLVNWYGARDNLKHAIGFNLLMDEAINFAMELEGAL